MKKIKFLSLFSGIGGFELGIKNSKYGERFECIGYSEIDKYADSIYKRHFPSHINLGDATKIKTEELPDFDLLVGGFPCQSFSIAGKRGGFDDTRGTLFFEIARICADKRPRYLLLENVRGLLSHEGGETFKKILEVLASLGYITQWSVLNSKDFHVPQNRERIYIEGYLGRECANEVLSVRENCSKSDDAGINNERERERALVQINNYKKTHQDARVYDKNGLSICLNARGHNGFYR